MYGSLRNIRLFRILVFIVNTYLLSPLSCLFNQNEKLPDERKPVFIIGAPRCGSTLLTQILMKAFDFGGFTNYHCLFFGAPELADYLFQPFSKKAEFDYESEYGSTNKKYSPSECGDFWYRFFRRKSPYVTRKDVNSTRMQCLRNTICKLTRVQKKTLLLKNLYTTLRLGPITEHIPEALFIVVKRNILDNAHSILEARMQNMGSYHHWWSVPSQRIDELINLPPEEQVVEQINDIYALIDKHICEENINSDRILILQYEEICDDVHGTLEKVESFLKKHDVDIKRNLDVPEKFERKTKVNIDRELYTRLVKYISNSRQ